MKKARSRDGERKGKRKRNGRERDMMKKKGQVERKEKERVTCQF